ncbi:hypothetical protein DFJ43DRAFT_894859 [Lentinula guzmanii]|uniref:Meiotically up-regulated protein Msb1/Mug8 domain-containing protein n=1 Tax=Lentinula guzmanii TaxID=2804957 RepID=A0AA38MV72_9AGAR|nr:hypothetical protein DFJ43DRAFT_894859 [Lentinula guzmanii]
MSFLFSRSNSSSSSSEADFSPYPPYSSHTLSAILASLPTDDSGSFVGTVLPTSVSHSPSSHGPGGYGYLSSYPTLILGLNDLHDLVQLVSKYLDVETPFVFSNGSTTTDSGVPVAIDLDAGRVKRLIDKYVGHLISKNSGRQGQTVVDFDDEARFAGPHELGMLLRWGLARVIRIESTASHSTGTSSRALTRGLIPYLAYLNWAKQESLLGYPSSHFGGLLDTRTRVSVPVRVRDEFGGEEVVFKDEYKEVIPKLLRETLLTLLALLAKLVAHSAKSGVTPPGLSPLFGPLLFGLGPLPTEFISSSSTVNTPDPTSFESTYTAYLRSVHATEHCLFAFIRWQDTPPSQGGGGFGGVGGVPGRLKEWIKDYPRTLSGHSRVLAIADLLQSGGRRSKDQHSLGPRKGAKTVRVLAVRRTVPAYDADLVRSAARWGLPSYAATGGAGLSSNSLPGNKEWGRINPPVQVQQGGKGKGGRLAARYSESYRKKMNIPPGVEPGSSPYAPPLSSLSSSSSSYSSYSSYTSSPLTRSTSAASTYSLTDPSSPSPSPTSPSPSSRPSQQSRFKTLSDAHWGEFESSGFLSPPSSSSIRGAKDIDQALKFDLTESARKARTAKRERGSVNWGDFVNGGFDMSDGGRKPLTLSMSSHSDNGPGHGSFFNNNASDLDKSYVGADGRLTNVADFALDTGLEAALQFNLTEFGILGGSATTKGADKDKLGDSKGERGERERTITGISLGKRLKKKEKPLPPFTYDSTPLLLPGSETLIESAFVDVWTDLVSWGFAELGLSSGSAGALSLVGDLVMGMWNSSSLSSPVNPDAKAMALSRSVSRDNDARDGVERLEKAKWRSELFKECNWVLHMYISETLARCLCLLVLMSSSSFFHVLPVHCSSSCHSMSFFFLECTVFLRPVVYSPLAINLLSPFLLLTCLILRLNL